MNSNNVIMNQIPIDTFELFLNNSRDIELIDGDESYIIHIEPKYALEYYEKYFTSIVQKQNISSTSINHIPIYLDSDTKKLLSIKEVEKLIDDGVLDKLMSYIIAFDFGDGMKDYLVLEFPRSMFDEMIKKEESLNTDVPSGTLSFSVDLMYILVNDERFKDNNNFNFVTDIDNGDVKGIIQEPDYKEGGDVKILQLY